MVLSLWNTSLWQLNSINNKLIFITITVQMGVFHSEYHWANDDFFSHWILKTMNRCFKWMLWPLNANCIRFYSFLMDLSVMSCIKKLSVLWKVWKISMHTKETNHKSSTWMASAWTQTTASSLISSLNVISHVSMRLIFEVFVYFGYFIVPYSKN